MGKYLNCASSVAAAKGGAMEDILRFFNKTRLAAPSEAPLQRSEGWSGKRDSNPRPQPWQGCALPTKLLPQIFVALYQLLCHPKPRSCDGEG